MTNARKRITMLSKVNMKGNFTGRSVKGAGAYFGKATTPCSQSGMDPNLARGQSSTLNYEMIASNK